MAWLFHPDDYGRLVYGLVHVKGLPRAGLGAQEIRIDQDTPIGHIRDTGHPEIGCVTFAEFGVAYAKVLEDERRAFDAAVAKLTEVMQPHGALSVPCPFDMTTQAEDIADECKRDADQLRAEAGLGKRMGESVARSMNEILRDAYIAAHKVG